MVDDSVVPTSHVSCLPLPSHRRIGLLGEAVLEESERVVALSLGHADESSDESRVDKDGLETGNGVNSDDGVGWSQ